MFPNVYFFVTKMFYNFFILWKVWNKIELSNYKNYKNYKNEGISVSIWATVTTIGQQVDLLERSLKNNPPQILVTLLSGVTTLFDKYSYIQFWKGLMPYDYLWVFINDNVAGTSSAPVTDYLPVSSSVSKFFCCTKLMVLFYKTYNSMQRHPTPLPNVSFFPIPNLV